MPPQHNGSEELPAVPAQSRGLALRLADSGCMETCRCEPRGWASKHKLGRAPRELTEKAAALCCDLQAQASSLPGAAWLVGEGLSHTAPVTGLVILFYNSPQGTSLGAGAQPTPQPLQGGGWGLQGCARAIQPAAGQLHGQGNLLPAARVSTGFPGGGTKNISRSQSSVSPLPRQGQTKRGADSKATILLMRHHPSHRAGPSSPPHAERLIGAILLGRH